MYTFLHYEGVQRWVFFRVRRRTYRLWEAIPPTFYNLGAFCRYKVKPWSEKFPIWVHELRATYYKRKAASETRQNLQKRRA